MQQGSISRNSGASSSLSTISPSFNSYSSENIADIAARVIHELNISNDHHYDDDFYPSNLQNDAVSLDNHEEIDDNDEDDYDESEFEFAVLCGEDTSSPISADEIFSNGQIKPIYPIFGQKYDDAVLENESFSSKTTSSSSTTTTTRLPLRTLMSEDREMRKNDSVSSTSTSSSDDNNSGAVVELEGVPPETYCVWAPPKGGVVDEGATMKKKSNSTGTSSKRWRFKDLLHRSHSDGKETFVFLTPAQNNNGSKITGVKKVTAVNNNNNGKKTEEVKIKSKKKNKSYLQYTPDVVGFFGNVNGINRTIRPF